MKKLFLFLFASLLSISMFAEIVNDGSTKAKAVPYAWGEGIKVTSDAGVGKWYVVDLFGKFDPATGKSAEGNADANIVVSNPLAEKANVDVTAYVGDNEMSRHFSLAPGEFKTMNIGAGFLVRSGIRYVHMFIVMDVTIPIEQAEKIEVVVEDAPANSTPFVPVDFDWTNFPAKTVANVIPANKETWVKIKFPGVTNGYTYKFYIEKDNATPITINAGIAYDCPASSIQEQSSEMKSATTEKVLDEAKLSMMPDSIYIRIKAAQELRIYAQQVAIPAPEPGAQPIFNILTGNAGDPAIEVLLWDNDHQDRVYTLDAAHLVYSVDYATLQADDENHYRQIEVHNGGTSDVTIVGKASKTYYDHTTPGLVDPDQTKDGNVYSVATKTVTIPAGQTYVKKIDKTMQSVVGSQSGDKIWALGPEFPNVTFKLTQVPVDPEYCKNATPFVWDTWNNQAGNSYKWYEINIHDAKKAKADIILTMETADGSEANITVDMAAACEAGEPLQNYSGKSKSTTKTLTYSLYKDKQSDYMYARVRTDKAIKVKAEMQTAKVWNGSKWSGDENPPTANEAARIEGDLTIGYNQTINALGLTLAGGKITIENGGKLLIGEEGVKGSENVDQITIQEGGVMLISYEANTNYKPFVTVEKELHFGAQPKWGDGATLRDLHEFIALPVENRQEAVGVRYLNWGLYSGWQAEPNGFRNTFEGYNVYKISTDEGYGDFAAKFKGQLVSNYNISFTALQWGWYACGNSLTAPIRLSDIYAGFEGASADEKAVHIYVSTPTYHTGVGYFDDNYYIPVTEEIAGKLHISEIAPMQGFFLHTNENGGYRVNLDYTTIYNSQLPSASPAPKRRANVANNRSEVAAVLSDSRICDFVYMIEGEAGNAHKMIGNGLAIYAEDGLAQVANDNLIGTTLTIHTNNATEYTLHFAWLNGETMYLKDLVNGNIIAMTEDTKYTFTAEPNSVSERFQVIGRNDAPTAIENSEFIEGANKFIENGKVVIIKNGVKYNVLGAEL